MSRKDFESRAISAAYASLKERGYVSAVDVFLGMGALSQEDHEDWRRGRVPYLEKVIQGNLKKISCAMKAVRSWAGSQGLKPSETVYRKWGKGCKHDLRFSKSGALAIERAYRTHFVSKRLRVQKEEKAVQARGAALGVLNTPAAEGPPIGPGTAPRAL